LHVERIGHLSSILVKHNIIVVASFISPYAESRQFARQLSTNFIEIYINTPLEVCEKRDTKGLYLRARKGEIKQFTGIDAPYEEPKNPEIIVDTSSIASEENVKKIMKYIKNRNLV